MGDKHGHMEGFQKYIPQHPLPAEVQNMTRDETVCRYCGVSYLIHNEIKALEEKLKATEAELKHYKGSREREASLHEQLQLLQEREVSLHKELELLQDQVSRYQNEERSLKEKIDELTETNGQVTEKNKYLNSACDKYRTRSEWLCSSLSSLQVTCSGLVKAYKALSQATQADHQVFTESLRNLQDHVTRKVLQDFEQLQSLANSLAKEKAQVQATLQQVQTENNQLVKQLSAQRDETSKFQTDRQQLNQLETLHQELISECDSLREKFQVQTIERLQEKEELRARLEEAEQRFREINLRNAMSEGALNKLQKESREKENELESVTKELNRLKKKYDEQQETLEIKISQSSSQSAGMKEQWDRCRADLEAMKKEREMMITAHQTQIEDLRDSFKRKLADKDRWPDKMEEMLRTEKERHSRELATLERKLKENFVLELQIEKDKCRTMMDKQTAAFREKELELQEQMSRERSSHESRLADIHTQLASYKAQARETENTLREEITSLKKIIQDLEGRLGRLDAGSEHQLNEVRLQLKQCEVQVNNERDAHRKTQGQLTAAKEEITFLQETVRRECEERFELTEAMAQLKEELLTYKRPPGGYSSQSSKPVRTPNYIHHPISREEMALYKRARTPPIGPHPPSSPASSARSTNRQGLINENQPKPANRREAGSTNSNAVRNRSTNETEGRGLTNGSVHSIKSPNELSAVKSNTKVIKFEHDSVQGKR